MEEGLLLAFPENIECLVVCKCVGVVFPFDLAISYYSNGVVIKWGVVSLSTFAMWVTYGGCDIRPLLQC